MKKHLMLVAAAALLGVVSASSQTVSVSVGRELGTITEQEKVWTSSLMAPRVTLSADNGTFSDAYDLLTFNTESATCNVLVTTPNEYYYISSISFKVKGVNGDEVTVSAGSTSVTTNSSLQDFEAAFTQRDAAVITLVPNVAENKAAQFTDFTVTMTPKKSHVIGHTPLSREGWTATACSWATSEGGSTGGSNPGTGNIANLIDDAATSYWHSNWGTCNQSSRHFFQIDLGSEQTFDYCSFRQRRGANSWNGAVVDVQIFVGDTDFGMTHNAVTNFLSTHTPVAIGSLEATSPDEQYVEFPSAQTARYILVVPTRTVNPGNISNPENKFACLADFGVGTCQYETWNLTLIGASEANSRIEAKREELRNLRKEWEGLIADDEFGYRAITTPHYTGEVVEEMIDDVIDRFDESAQDIASLLALADGRVVYIKNLRRSDQNGKYLGVMADGKVNSYTYPCERAKWYVQRESATSQYFYLVNPETRGYIKAGQNSVVTDKSNATTFELKQITYQSNIVTAIKNSADDKGLNLDKSTNPLSNFSHTDGGSAWACELAATKATGLKADGTYYRIRSNRGLSKMLSSTTEGSLLGIYPFDNEDLSSQPVTTKKDGLGTLWSIETVGNNEVKLRNAAADFEGMDAPCYFGRKETGSNKQPRWGYVKTDGEGMAVQLVNAIGAPGSSYVGNHPYAVGVYTPNFTGNGSNHYMDNDGNGYPVFSEWKPGAEKTDNGSIYYFEEVPAEEVEALKTGYCDEIYGMVTSSLPDYHGYEPLFGDAFSEATDLMDTFAATSVKEANKILLGAKNNEYADDVDSIQHMIDAVLANPSLGAMADGREVQFVSVGRPGNKLNVKADGNLFASNAAADISSVWVLNHVDGLNYTLRNHGTNTFIGHYSRTSGGDAGSNPIPMVGADEAQIYTIDLLGSGKLTLSAGEGNYPALHFNGSLVKWSADNNNSYWSSSLVDAEPMEIDLDVTDADHVKLIFSHANPSVSIAANGARGDHHVITVDKVEEDVPLTRSLSVPSTFATTTDEGDGTHSIDLSSLEPGKYTVTVPTGFFVANGKLSARSSASFDKEGTVLSITDIDAIDGDDAQWFTVQGVRVAAPASAGIYIKRTANATTKIYVK